jgi:beta-glucosidase-like glycosyl hydrolase
MQTCLTKFFKYLGSEKPNYEWLFQKEEADRKKRQEEAERRRREREQRQLEEEERLYQEWQARKAQRDLERRARREELQRARQKESRLHIEGRHVNPLLGAPSRLCLQPLATPLVNETHSSVVSTSTAANESNISQTPAGSPPTSQLYLGNRLAALNAEWLKEAHITHILNCTVDVPCYYQREDRDILVCPHHFSTSTSPNIANDDTGLSNDNSPVLASISCQVTLSPSAANLSSSEPRSSKADSSPLVTSNISNSYHLGNEENDERRAEGTAAEMEDPEAASLCVTYRRLCLEDSNSQVLDLDEVRACVTYIDNVLRAGGNMLVHCREGKSRSPTILLYWLMSSELLRPTFTLREGYTLLQTLQPSLNINHGFLRQLMQFERLHFQVNENSIDFFNKADRATKVDYSEAPEVTDITSTSSFSCDSKRISKSRKKTKLSGIVLSVASTLRMVQSNDNGSPPAMIDDTTDSKSSQRVSEERIKNITGSKFALTLPQNSVVDNSQTTDITSTSSSSSSTPPSSSSSSSSSSSTLPSSSSSSPPSSSSFSPPSISTLSSAPSTAMTSTTFTTKLLNNYVVTKLNNDDDKKDHFPTNTSRKENRILGKRKRYPKNNDAHTALINPKGTIFAYFQRIDSRSSSTSTSVSSISTTVSAPSVHNNPTCPGLNN